jgi:hypothetical protein
MHGIDGELSENNFSVMLLFGGQINDKHTNICPGKFALNAPSYFVNLW